MSNTDQKLGVSELVGAEAARRGEWAIRAVYLSVVVVVSSFATAVVAFITRQLPWLIAFGLLLVATALASRWGLRLAREAGATASTFVSERLGYPVTVELPRRQTADSWLRQINAAIRVHEATHTPADSESDTPTDQSRRRLGEVERRLAELQAVHTQKVVATTQWGYAMLLGLAPIVATLLFIPHVPLWLLLLAAVGLVEMVFCEVHVFTRLRGMRRSTSELRQLRRERRTLLPPGET